MTTLNEPNAQNQESFNEKQVLDLTDAGNRKVLAKRILDDIDSYCRFLYDDGPRTHLGASKIGHPCSRHLWYSFRWVAHRLHSGRMLRLFNRGHETEPRFIEWLRGIGCTVWDLAEDGNQYRIHAVSGHFGGSLDGVNRLPERYQITQPLLLECKTNKTGSDFNKLKKEGVAKAKPVHYAQASTYGKNYGFQYCLYVCIDKNTDELYIEIVELNWRLADQMEQKAQTIIFSKTPPPKLSESPTYHECKSFCEFKEVCHEGAQIAKNCRSCESASPVENKEWFCSNPEIMANIPKDFIMHGCGYWKPIV